MANIVKLTITLTIISAIAGLAIGVANEKTKDKIAAQQQQIRLSAIKAVFPDGVTINEMTDTGNILPNKYWVAFSPKNDKPIGYAFEMSGAGYAGDIKFMVGTAVDGKISGMIVLDQNETPGLGSRVNEVASTKYIWYPIGGDEKTKPWFTEQFEGLSSLKPIGIDKIIGEWHTLDERAKADLQSRNAVTAITGSTISTAAFTRSIERKMTPYLQELGGYCCPATKKKKESESVDTDTENDN